MNTKEKLPFHSTWAEIDLSAIAHNFKALKRCAGLKVRILSVVKADAYGHGMLPVAKLLNRLGTDFFGVADLDEGIQLRKQGISKPILIFENALPQLARYFIDFKLTPTVCTLALAVSLNQYAKKHNTIIPIHIKVDTGMGRLGVWYQDALSFVAICHQLKNIAIEGVYTHLPCADTDISFTRQQIRHFKELVLQIKKIGATISYVHAGNSAGLVSFKDPLFNLVRPGLMLYGMYPNDRFHAKILLKPAMCVKSRIMFVKRIHKGRSISYGRSFVAKRDMVVATLPIGYRDGYFRILSNASMVLIQGKCCPLIGRVTMDQIVVDISHVGSPEIGMEVVLLGRQGKEEILADDIANLAKTINYEVTCSLGSRLPKVYV